MFFRADIGRGLFDLCVEHLAQASNNADKAKPGDEIRRPVVFGASPDGICDVCKADADVESPEPSDHGEAFGLYDTTRDYEES